MNEFEVHWEAVKLLQSLGCLSHIIVSHTVPLKAGIHKQLHVCILNVPPGQKFNSFSDSIRIGELKLVNDKSLYDIYSSWYLQEK